MILTGSLTKPGDVWHGKRSCHNRILILAVDGERYFYTVIELSKPNPLWMREFKEGGTYESPVFAVDAAHNEADCPEEA